MRGSNFDIRSSFTKSKHQAIQRPLERFFNTINNAQSPYLKQKLPTMKKNPKKMCFFVHGKITISDIQICMFIHQSHLAITRRQIFNLKARVSSLPTSWTKVLYSLFWRA